MPDRFEADLRAVREARGLTLDEIQRQSRIPVDVLRRFEDGGLVGDPTYNEVYLRAFLQSYAKAIGIPAADVIAARQQQEAGAYDGALHPDRRATPPPAAGRGGAGRDDAPRRATADGEAPRRAAEPEATPPPRPAGGAAPAVEALAAAPDPTVRREEPEPERTAPQTRVSRPAVPTARRSFDKNWGAILGLFAVVVAVLAVALYFLVFAGDDEPDDVDGPDVVAIGDGATAEIDTTGIGAGAAGGGPQLQLPIEVTVEATGGNGLQSFRVTEDAGARQPYWIDLGSSQTFSADSVLVLWGQDTPNPGEATYVFQGQRFTPRAGQPLRITPATGQRVLDSLATAR